MSYDIGKNLVVSGSTTVLTRRFKTAYRKFDSDKSTVIKNGVNYFENLNLPFLDIATYPHGPTDTDDIINVPANYLFVGITNTGLLETNQTSSITQKSKYTFPVVHGRDYLSSSLSYGEVLKSNIALPVNFISGNITDGYQSQVVNSFMSGVIITNIHNDAYGPDKETGLQGPFTNQWVGGRQSRHVSINRGSDSYTTRPEAWKLLLGQLGSSSYQATLGFVGSDYPYPEGNDYEPSFPVVVHKRATYYREETAKRPVNIKNIKYSTGSYEIGNYSNNYEVVSMFDRTSNNRLLRKTLLENQSNVGITTELSGVLRTGTSGRVDFELVDRISGSSKSVIGNRFAAPGGARYSSRGFLNRYAEEFSPYNGIPYRNREVIGNSHNSGMPYSVYAVSGALNTGSIKALSTRSDFGGYTSGSTTVASLHKVNRNTTYVSKEGISGLVGSYDNFYVSHQIPRKDHGYAWIRDSLPYIVPTASVWEFYSHANNLVFTSSNTIASSILGIKVNGSQVTGGVEQPSIIQDFVGLNTMIVEPINTSSNLIGTSSILSITSSYLTSFATSSNLFNSMLIHRNGGYGLPTFKQLSHHRNDKLTQYYRANNIIQNVNPTGGIQNYTEPVTDFSSYPIIVEAVHSNVEIGPNSNIEDLDYVDSYFTYENYATKFSNPDLMRDLQLVIDTSEERETILKQVVLPHTSSNPYYYEPIKITYSKTIFPFSNISRRKRTSFMYPKWKDLHSERLATNYIVNPSYTLNTASIWPLDGRINYATTSASFSQTFLDQSTEGLLQNLYTLRYTGSGSPASLPIYYYKQSLRSVDSTKSPSGISNGFLPIPTAISESVLFANSTKWQVYDDFGYKPFYNSYDEWIGETHKQFKNYAILPEYIISNKIENYLENNFSTRTLFENYLEVTGASIYALTSSNDLSTAAYLENLIDTNYNSGSEITIQITCNTLEKFLPYSGFYPVERTLELVNAFSSSYSKYVSIVEGTSSVSFGTPTFSKNYRTLISPLFAPGILYNTIKSGIAVDYPVLTGSLLTASTPYDSVGTSSYQIANNNFDTRLPFETILEPENYMNGIRLIDMNPYPEVRLTDSTASLFAPSSINSYKLMINNFLAETTNLFLKNSSPSYIRSKQVGEVRAESGKRYQALLKIYKTTANKTKNLGTQTLFVDDYPRPQYSSSAEENITMFSNPLGFGPPCGSGTGSVLLSGGGPSTQGTKDSSNGFNSPFTPPYYDGESWAIIEFAPNTTKTYTLDEIIGSSSVKYIRYEFDETADYTNTVGNSGPQGSSYMNANAMQVSASLNLFKIIDTKELQPETSNIGARLSSTAQSSNKKIWEISSKFETPILNFHPLYTGKTVTQSTGSEYGLANAGMWLQYGVLPENDQGIFMQITDVPDSYIKYGTYGASGSVTNTGFSYNTALGIDTNSIKSLVDLVGFSTEPVRMGELAETKIIKEAIVIVPYTISNDNQRLFLKLNKTEVDNYLNATNSALGSKLSQTTKDQLDKIQDYVLPPHLDFINNSSVEPFALYVFEIEKQLDKTDLSHIWQNVLPPSLDKFENNTYSISHKLNPNELLSTLNVDQNTTIKFMCFKVKQRAITKYEFANYNEVEADNTENNRIINNPRSLLQNAKKLKKATLNFDRTYDKDLIGYNWPYDYCSLVESAKIDATVVFSKFNPNEPLEVTTQEPELVGQTSNNPTNLFGNAQSEGTTMGNVTANTSIQIPTNFR